MKNSFEGQKIVFFDGICVLCNRSVDFLLKKDHKKRLKYASLQSGLASEYLRKLQYTSIPDDTIIFYDEARIFTKSTAVLKIAGYLGFPYSLFAVFLVIPLIWRDWMYDLIARNRLRWFGKRDTCRIIDGDSSLPYQ